MTRWAGYRTLVWSRRDRCITCDVGRAGPDQPRTPAISNAVGLVLGRKLFCRPRDIHIPTTKLVRCQPAPYKESNLTKRAATSKVDISVASCSGYPKLLYIVSGCTACVQRPGYQTAISGVSIEASSAGKVSGPRT